MIKRSAAILLSAALSVTLSSCGKSKNSVTTGNIKRDFSERSEAEKNYYFYSRYKPGYRRYQYNLL